MSHLSSNLLNPSIPRGGGIMPPPKFFLFICFMCASILTKLSDFSQNILSQLFFKKKFFSVTPPGGPGVIFKSEFYRNLIFWNWYAKEMVKIFHNFFCEKISPLCIFLGILTDFAQKYAPLCLLRSPKYPKIDKNPILGIFLVRFLEILTPLYVIYSNFYYSSWKNLSIRSFWAIKQLCMWYWGVTVTIFRYFKKKIGTKNPKFD